MINPNDSFGKMMVANLNVFFTISFKILVINDIFSKSTCLFVFLFLCLLLPSNVLQKRRCGLLSLKDIPTIESQKIRYEKSGYDFVIAKTMSNVEQLINKRGEARRYFIIWTEMDD